MEGDEDRDGVPRQADDGRLAVADAGAPDPLGASRLLGDAVEAGVGAQRPAHHLVGALGDAARGDDQVRLGRAVEGVAQLSGRVPGAQVGGHGPSGFLDETAQEEAVGVRDLPVGEAVAGGGEFRSGGDDEDAGARVDAQGAVPDRGGGRQFLAAQHRPRPHDEVPGLDRLSPVAHVSAPFGEP